MKIGKYEFDSREVAESKIKALGTAEDEDGNEYPTHKHTLLHLGHIVLEAGEYDEEGEETKAPVLSVNQSISQSVNQPISHSVNQSIRQSGNKSIQSISSSVN